MDKIIVYVDDAAHARQILKPMLGSGQQTRWELVACPARLTRHASRWISRSGLEKWHAQWAEQLLADITPLLRAHGAVSTPVARGALAEMTERLTGHEPSTRVLDARRPRFGQDLEPVVSGQPVAPSSRWSVPGSVATLGAVLVLASE